MPETEAEGARIMALWGAWIESLGAAVADGGNPVGPSSTVHSGGPVTGDGGSNPASGYRLVNADSMEQALELAKRCPILEGGGSVQVAETFDM